MKKTKRALLLLIAISAIFTFSACSEYGPSTGNDDIVISIPSSAVNSEKEANTEQQPSTPANTSENNATAETTTTTANTLQQNIMGFGLPVILLVGFYLLILRPQRKKDKEAKNLRSNIEVGDEITTIGGIVGKVIMVKDDDQLIIETGADKSKLRIMKWAVQQKNTISDK